MSDLNKNKEALEENKKNDTIDLKGKFIREFSKDSLDGSDKNTFLDEVMNNDSIESGSYLKKGLDIFQSKNDEFNNLDQSKITIYDLQRSVGKKYSSLEKSRSNYLENSFSKYDLNDKQRELLEKEIKNTKEYDLKKLTNSENENNKFINKTFGENKISKINNFKVFENISELDIKTRLSKLSETDKKSVGEALYNFKNLKITDVDIRELFSTNFLSPIEKKEIISNYIPYISLKKAKDLGLIKTQSEVDLKKKNILEPILKKNGLSGNILDLAIKGASEEDIEIKSSEFFNDAGNLNTISEGIGFINIEKDFKGFIEDVKEDIDNNGPQSLSDLKTFLTGEEFSGDFENLDNFKEGSIIKIISINKEGAEEINYSEITSISDINKNISLKPIGSNTTGKEIINSNSNTISKPYSFSEIISAFKGKGKKAIFYTERELNKLIDDPKNNISNSDLKQYSPKDLQDDPSIVTKLKDKYIDNIQNDLDNKIEEKAGIDSQISSLKENLNDDNKKENESQISTLNIKKSKLDLEIDELTNKLEISNNSSIETNTLLQFSNELELKNKIDEIDSEGKKLGLEKGMYITSSKGIHEISGIDWETGEIILKGKGIPDQKFSFEEFYQAFKINKAKREKRLESLENLVKENSENHKEKDIWNNYEVKNGKLHIKKVDELSKDKSSKVDYLVSSNSDEIFKIDKISGDKITFNWGERKSINSLDKKIKNKYKNNIKIGKDGKPEKDKNGELQYEGELLSISNKTETLSLNEFQKLINKEKEEFHPDWQTGKQKTIENPQESENTFRSPFMTGLFNNISLGELISGGKMMVEGIEEYFKKGNEIHAAKVALRMGKMLPAEVQADLLIKVERAEDESMDKEIESLGKVDSPIATARIKGWLQNRNTPEYKKEAGLMFMIKKYGHLNSKELKGFSGKFFWYEAFGGKIGDKLFLDIKNEAEQKNQTFTEEYLMYIFIKKQCGDNGYNSIKRRSRLHKTFKSSWPNGVEEEVKTGQTDAGDERTAEARVAGGIGEAMGGTYSNAVGWFEEAINKGDSLEIMSEGFFTMLYSGAMYNIDQKTYNKIKGLWDTGGMPIIMTRFSSFKSDMELFNKTVLDLSMRIGDEYGDEFPNIKTEAKKIFNNAHNQSNTKEQERLQDANKFWKKYGTPLSRSLSMVHTGDNTYSKTDKILFLESNSNPNFKEYYNKTREFATEGTFKKDLMEDMVGEAGVGGMNTHQITKQYLKMSQGGALTEGKSGGMVWNNILNDIESVSSMDISIFQKRKYLKETLRDLFSGFLANHGPNLNALKGYNHPTGDIGYTLNSWNINMVDDFGSLAPKEVKDKNNIEVDKILNRVIDNILNGEKGNEYGLSNTGLEPNIDNTKKQAEEIINDDDLF